MDREEIVNRIEALDGFLRLFGDKLCNNCLHMIGAVKEAYIECLPSTPAPKKRRKDHGENNSEETPNNP